MSCSIEILRAADNFLDKLSKQQPSDAEAIEGAIDGLGETPRPPGCKSLKGYSGVWRIRVGNYRVCYQDPWPLRLAAVEGFIFGSGRRPRVVGPGHHH